MIEKLSERILSINKNRVLIGVPSNPEIQYYLSADLQQGGENQETMLITFFDSLMHTGGGAITLKVVNDDNTFDVCGICVKSNGEWFAVPKEEMQNAYTTCNECDEPIHLPDNINIVDFNVLCHVTN